jgi:hypothetical protein
MKQGMFVVAGILSTLGAIPVANAGHLYSNDTFIRSIKNSDSIEVTRDFILASPIFGPNEPEVSPEREDGNGDAVYYYVLTGDRTLNIAGEIYKDRRNYVSLDWSKDPEELRGIEFCAFEIRWNVVKKTDTARLLEAGSRIVLGDPLFARGAIQVFPPHEELSADGKKSELFSQVSLVPFGNPVLSQIQCKLRGENPSIGQLKDVLRVPRYDSGTRQVTYPNLVEIFTWSWF